ncbi:DNA translocase FtsK 4TM domain-containing protein, partial [Pseudoalteromonas sp.]
MRLNGVQRLLETGLIISTFTAIFILCALISFDPADAAWSQTSFSEVRNITGAAGAWIADVLLLTFGWLAYLVPAAIQIFGYLLFKQPHRILQLDYTTLALRVIGFALFITSATAISSINFDDIYNFSSGGVVGDVIESAMMPAFNFTGTSILLLCFFFAGLTLLTGVSWVDFVDYLGELIVRFYRFSASYAQGWMHRERIAGNIDNDQMDAQFDDDIEEQIEIPEKNSKADKQKAINKPQTPFSEPPMSDDFMPFDELDDILDQEIGFSAIDDEPMDTEAALNALDQSQVVEPEKPVTTVVSPARPMPKPKAAYQPPPTAKEKFEQLLTQEPPPGPLPSLDLLDRPDKAKNPISQEELDTVSRLVETKLLDFNVQATVVAVYPGPVVTRFELDLAPGIKVSKITGLAKDLARSLSAISVRVVEVIPGKTYVGIELPNKHREIVRLSEVINAPKFEQNPSPLTMVLGKDIAGQPVCADLGKMPHLLVAGTTGSGKSVGVNVMIVSLLYKSGPDDVRMIMIDPKMLELSVYEGIPHLLCEVVTDMKEAANALRWCVGEMERRYKLMSALGVRNLKGYNQKVLEANEAGYPILDPLFKDTDGMKEGPDELGKLPSIVVVIDEFADMMMIVGKKVEELIAR